MVISTLEGRQEAELEAPREEGNAGERKRTRREKSRGNSRQRRNRKPVGKKVEQQGGKKDTGLTPGRGSPTRHGAVSPCAPTVRPHSRTQEPSYWIRCDLELRWAARDAPTMRSPQPNQRAAPAPQGEEPAQQPRPSTARINHIKIVRKCYIFRKENRRR